MMMDEITLDLDKVCGNNIYTRDDGHILYDRIEESLKSYSKVIVQFNEREIASESFLDEAIVEHYFRQTSYNVTNRIILRGVTKPDQMLLGTIFEYRKRLENKEAKKLAKINKTSALPASDHT
jgi:hypothetical protein